MRIQHNIMAMNAYRNYTNNVSAMQKNLEKLSSGYKINRAGDDAAGLAISEKMRAQITGLETAQKNAKDGISLVQTAEGALTEVHDMLNRMVELATQSANGTYDDTVDRAQMQKEVDQLLEEINRIADSSNFNGINLLDGSLGLDKAYTITNTDKVESEVVDGFVKTMAATSANNDKAMPGTNTILHADGAKAQLGEFTIDLQQVTVSAKTGAKSDFQLKIGGVAVATITGESSSTALDGKAMAAAIAKALDGTTATKALMINSAGAFAKGAAGKGALYYGAKDNGDGTVTFTIKGYSVASTTTFNAVAAGAASSTVKTIMDAVGSAAAKKNLDVAVEIGKKTNGDVHRGENVGTLNIKNNKKDEGSQLGNTKLTLDMDKIQDGYVMTIAGEKYTFAIGENSAHTGDENVIDLTGIVKNTNTLKGLTDTTKQHDVMAAITRATAENKTLNVGFDGNWGTMTLTEKSNGDGTSADSVTEDMKKAMGDKDTFKALVSLASPDIEAGQTISTADGKVKDNTSLTIAGQRYTFNEKGTGDDPDAIYIKTADGLQGLSKKLTEAEVTNTFENGKLTVRGETILGKGLSLQIGDTADHFNQLNVSVQDMHAKSLGIDGLKINSQADAADSIKKIKDAINTVSDVRGSLGATQNRLDHTINNLSVMTENIQDAESTIRDVDVAEEMMAYTKNNILIQSAQAMLAQANQVPQGVLQLLQ